MKFLKLFIVFLLLLNVFSFSQNDQRLVGTWYGKIPGYQFRQYGSSTIYTKEYVGNYKQRLIVDRAYNYVYFESFQSDTIRNEGRLVLKGDTLIFLQTNTNSESYEKISQLKYFVYSLSSNSLIYSYQAIPGPEKDQNDNDNIFKKVEESAEYSLGENQFLKTLYNSLQEISPESRDSVFMNKFEVVVGKDSSVNITSLKATSANEKYFNAIKQGLMNLKSPIIPAKQNGRLLNAFFHFTLIY